MHLPWFPFHIDKFLADTLALDGEAGGGYLFLMLHYYATEKPPRDNDRTLATIARMPMDRWLERRPDIESFFDIRDGLWHHTTIEAEMLEAKHKHSLSKAKAVAGAAARWAKDADQPAAPKPKRRPATAKEHNNAPSNAQAQPQAQPEQSLSDAHLHLHNNSLSTDRDAIEEGEQPIGTPIDPKFWPDPNHIAVCKIDGATDEIIQAEVAAFVATKQENGAFSNDWDASWSMWWKRWKEHQAKVAKASKPRAAPRIEVSGRPEITEAQWDAEAAKFAKDGASLWSRQLGPEPGMGGCRCPPEILTRHGINPTTGIVAPKAWRPAPTKETV